MKLSYWLLSGFIMLAATRGALQAGEAESAATKLVAGLGGAVVRLRVTIIGLNRCEYGCAQFSDDYFSSHMRCELDSVSVKEGDRPMEIQTDNLSDDHEGE